MSNKVANIIVFFTVFVAGIYSFGGLGWNQNSRLDLLHALLYEGRIQIDSYHKNTQDKALIRGHYYSEKAPGTALVALPAFALSQGVLWLAGVSPTSPVGWQYGAWMTTAGSAGLMLGIAAVVLLQVLRRFVAENTARLVTLVLALATSLFTYATTLFSHTIAASFIAIALLAILRENKVRRNVWPDYGAGLAAGAAIACEYTSAIIVAVLLMYVLRLGYAKAGRFMTATLLPLLMIPLNNVIISGSPFMLAYYQVPAFNTYVDAHSSVLEFFRIDALSLTNMAWILFSEKRGLFFWSPFLWLAFPGFIVLWKKSRSLTLTILGACVLHILYASSISIWDGGWSLGPRHLTTLIPLLSIPVAIGFVTYPKFGRVLGILSLLLTTLAALSDPQTHPSALHPLRQLYIPRYIQGLWSVNIGSLLGLKRSTGVVMLLGIQLILWCSLLQQRHLTKEQRGIS